MRPATQAFVCQFKATSGLLFQSIVQGMATGWSSPGVSKLKAGDGPFKPTTEEVSWIVSLSDLGFMFGALVSFLVFRKAGHRYNLLVIPFSFALWILLTYIAKSAAYLYAARFLLGIGMGVNFAFSSVYIGEVATPKMRSFLILATIFITPVGQLLAFVIGPYVTYWQEALLPVPLLVVCVFSYLAWTRQTPYHHTLLGRHDDALRELSRLRQGLPRDEILREVEEIRRSVKQQLEDATTWRQTFSPPGAKRAAAVVVVISGCLALFGVNIVESYTQEIFEEADSPLSKSVSSMLVIGVKMVMVLIAMYLIEKVGRRPQLSISAFLNTLAMTAMAGYFLAKENLGWSVSGVKWLPLVALMVFMAAAGGGVMPVSHVLMGELLSVRAKKVVAPVMAVISSGTSFGISKSFLPLGDSVGFALPFGIFAVTNLFIVLFTVFFVPETKEKTLAQIQDELSHRNREQNMRPIN